MVVVLVVTPWKLVTEVVKIILFHFWRLRTVSCYLFLFSYISKSVLRPNPIFFLPSSWESKSVLRLKPMNFLPLSFNLYAISNLYFGPTPSFKMRPRISMRGCVRPSVGPLVTLLFWLAKNERNRSKLYWKQSKICKTDQNHLYLSTSYANKTLSLIMSASQIVSKKVFPMAKCVRKYLHWRRWQEQIPL